MCKRGAGNLFSFAAPIRRVFSINWNIMAEQDKPMDIRSGIRVKQAIGKKPDMVPGKDQVILNAGMVERIVQGCIRMLLSAVLAGAQVLDGRAPFGVAMTAASGGGISGAARYWGPVWGVCASWR